VTAPTSPRSQQRRTFLKTAAVASAVTLAQTPFVHTAGSSTLRVALVGCGGRGTGAAGQALRADPDVKLVALADAFSDRLEACLTRLQADQGIAPKIDVPRERRFVGFDAYKQAIDAADVVLLCSPPGFRPMHIEAAVQANKHIFAEKPMAVDGPGVRRVLAAAEEARRRRLSLGSGFCWRYHPSMRDTVKRIHDGDIGDITMLHCNYLTGPIWHRAREQGWTDMEFQMRNWYYYTWLSGDFNVEQHVHSLDKMGWVMKNEYPVRCYGVGGRQVRTGPEFGHIFDHMGVVYEWKNGARCFAFCRQQAGCYGEVTDYIVGTKGKANLLGRGANTPYTITGEKAWRLPAAQDRRAGDMYQLEHIEQFAGIRSGSPINDGDWMAKSTLMAIMGRMACYTGKEVTWEQALNSTEDLSPSNGYRFDAVPPQPAVARPGVTPLA
jgi:predicted dehydrogenase